MPITAAFSRDYPDISVDVDLTNRFVDLVPGDVDVAIRMGRILWALETPLAQLALPLRTLVLTAVLVPLMVYALVPWVAKVLNRYAPAKHTVRRGPPPRR